jgi:hypothetical protein
VNRHPDHEAGRIAFRLRIGVTGHRELPDEAKLAAVVRQEIGRLIGLLRPDASTTIELAVISQLADGADRLVVHEVLAAAAERGQQARLEVVLPMRRDDYVRVQKFGAASSKEFNELLEQAILVSEPRHAGNGHSRHTAHAYEVAGHRVIASCDILLALWDGLPSGGGGGTAETLLAAASVGKPCVWIPTDAAEPVADNFAHGKSYDFYQQVIKRSDVPHDRAGRPRTPQELPDDTLKPLHESLKLLERYNRERLPAKFGERLRDEFKFPGGEDDWIAPFFLRATMLAAENQTRFARSTRAITWLAIIAATLLGVHLSLNSSPAWDWAEVTSLVAVMVIFLVMHERHFHDRWISYRFLAERLRSARYLIPAGVDFVLLRTTVTAYIERHPSDWIERTFYEFWQGERKRRKEPAPEMDDEALKQRLADEWIGKQISYHQKRSREHLRWQQILLITILILFAGALTCAILDAAVVHRSVTGCLSVAFPAAAASLGALLTVRQHRQLYERSAKMSRDLADARWEIVTAVNRRMIVSTAARAARIMAEESADWLGALWFLDVEHPG